MNKREIDLLQARCLSSQAKAFAARREHVKNVHRLFPCGQLVMLKFQRNNDSHWIKFEVVSELRALTDYEWLVRINFRYEEVGCRNVKTGKVRSFNLLYMLGQGELEFIES